MSTIDSACLKNTDIATGWIKGKQMNLNEILLGDAYELIKEIPNKSVDMVYTDIPYLYVYGDNGGTSEMGRDARKMKDALKEMKDGIDYSIFNEFIRVCKKTNIFIWCSRLKSEEANGQLRLFVR